MKSMLQKKSILFLTAILCCALWGSAFPCIKLGYAWLHIETTSSKILFAGYRFFLAGVITFIVGCVLEKRILSIERKSMPYIIAIGLFQTTMQYIFFYIGMSHISGTKGSLINACNAFVSILLSHFLMKGDKMTVMKTVGCIIGFLGILIINLRGGGIAGAFAWNGDGMIILCTIVYGSSGVFTKMISHRGTPMAITAYQLLFGSGALIVIGLLGGGQITGFTVSSLLLLLYMAVLSAVAFSLWTALLKYNPVSKVAIFGCSIPIFGTALSALILGEQAFSFQNIAALLCVSGGIILVNRDKDKEVK